MPGLRFKLCLVYAVTKHPWIQVPAGQIGIVIAQIGQPLPIGAKSAVYTEAFGDFAELRVFVEGAGEKKIKGQKGVQRPVLPPGTLAPIHPVAFLVITKPQVYGVPVSEELRRQMTGEKLTFASFGLDEKALDVTRIEPRATESGHVLDMIGVVTTLEGDPLPAGDIASRLGGFKDIETIEKEPPRPGAGQPSPANSELIETILGSKNEQHKSYQDFQAFLDKGGRIGLQHDPLLYGAYNLNPFLVRVEQVPMLVVEQEPDPAPAGPDLKAAERTVAATLDDILSLASLWRRLLLFQVRVEYETQQVDAALDEMGDRLPENDRDLQERCWWIEDALEDRDGEGKLRQDMQDVRQCLGILLRVRLRPRPRDRRVRPGDWRIVGL